MPDNDGFQADFMKKPNAPKKSVKTTHHRTLIGISQKKKTRALIIGRAIHVFASHGPDRPVIEDFVKAAGVSRGTFYNYFRTTQELLDAALDAVTNDLIAAVTAIVNKTSDPILRLTTAARIYFDKAASDPAFAAFLSSVPRLGVLVEERVREDLRQAMQKGLIRLSSEEVAFALAAGTMAFAIRSLAREGIRSIARDDVVVAILQGLGVRVKNIELALRQPLPSVETKKNLFV